MGDGPLDVFREAFPRRTAREGKRLCRHHRNKLIKLSNQRNKLQAEIVALAAGTADDKSAATDVATPVRVCVDGKRVFGAVLGVYRPIILAMCGGDPRNFFSKPPVEHFEYITESQGFMVGAMARVSIARIRDTAKSVHKVDCLWKKRLLHRMQEDQTIERAHLQRI